MKKMFSLVILHIMASFSYAQSATEFLTRYNNHIDPLKRLDSISTLIVTVKSKITGKSSSIGGSIFGQVNIDETHICEYDSKGNEKCENTKNQIPLELNLMKQSDDAQYNQIKYHLNIIPPQTFKFYKVTLANDSIFLLERIISLTQKHIFKFDAESLNLLETENSNITSSGDKFVSYTKYLHYQTKEGILIPSIVSYSSTFCEAVLEYKQITFR
ncbi:MAG: hypothetical protein ACKODM_10790 [Cytophagales bacterium]